MDPKAQMLGQLAPDTTDNLQTINGQLLNVVVLFGELKQSLNQKNAALGDLQTEFDTALEEYKNIVEGHHHYIDGMIDNLENLSESVTTALHETQTELIDALVEIQKDQIEAIIEQVNNAKDQKKSWWEQWQNSSAAFRQQASASQVTLEQNVAEVQDVVKSLAQKLAEGQEVSQAKVELLEERMRQVHHNAEEKVQQMGTLFQELHSQFSQQMETARANHLGPQVGKVLEEYQQKVTDELTPKVEEHTGVLTGSLQHIAEQLTSTRDKHSSVRQELSPHVDAIHDLLDPIGAALDAAKEAVGKVGLVFE